MNSLVTETGCSMGALVGQPYPPGGNYADALALFNSTLGYPLAWNNHFRSWDMADHTDPLVADIDAGVVPMLSMSPGGTLTAAQIASGSYDADIVSMAVALRALTVPVLFRYAFEMDVASTHLHYIGPPADYVAAWRHVYSVFQTQGATNVQFVWAPTQNAFPTKAAQWYPGNTYVQWIGVDGYNRFPETPWKDPADIFNNFYAWASAGHPAKPLMIAESGCTEDPANPGRKGLWMNRMDTWIKAHSQVKAAFYNSAIYTDDSGNTQDNRIDSSSSALDGFRAWTSDPYFQ